MSEINIVRSARFDQIAEKNSHLKVFYNNIAPWFEVGVSDNGLLYYRGIMSGWSFMDSWTKYLPPISFTFEEWQQITLKLCESDEVKTSKKKYKVHGTFLTTFYATIEASSKQEAAKLFYSYDGSYDIVDIMERYDGDTMNYVQDIDNPDDDENFCRYCFVELGDYCGCDCRDEQH